MQARPQDMSLGDFIQVFRLGAKSGVLQLLHGDEHGVIYVAAGRIVDATLARGPERTVTATRDEAVIQMLGWLDATFRFHHDAAVVSRPIRVEHDGAWLVQEGCRRRGIVPPARAGHQITPDTAIRLADMPASAQNGVMLSGSQWRVLSHIAGGSSLRALCHTTAFNEDIVLQLAGELFDLGLVEVIVPAAAASIEEPAARPTAAAGASGHKEWLPTGPAADAATLPSGERSHREASPPIAHQPPSGRVGSRQEDPLRPDPPTREPRERVLPAAANGYERPQPRYEPEMQLPPQERVLPAAMVGARSEPEIRHASSQAASHATGQHQRTEPAPAVIGANVSARAGSDGGVAVERSSPPPVQKGVLKAIMRRIRNL